MNITSNSKNFFFDRKVVIDYFGAKGKKTISALTRVGAFVRTRARSLLRRRKKTSPAGSPPSIHTSSATITLKNIQFAWDFKSATEVIGPIKLNQVDYLNGQRGSGTVPQLLEFGGYRSVVEVRRGDGSWVRADQRSRRRLATMEQRVRTAHYAAHPWMKPAMDTEIAAGTIAPAWSAALKAA